MQVYYGLESIPDNLQKVVLIIGNFDGVHRGHQQVIAQAGMFAEQNSGIVAALTFDPHPLAVVNPAGAPQPLMPLEEKIRCLAQSGVDVVVVLHSEPRLLNMAAEEFIEQVLVQKFHPVYIVEGDSFRFGKDRRGSVELLKRFGEKHGFHVFGIDPVQLQVEAGETVQVSSSLIRQLVRQGKVHRAQLCLGRPYSLFGVVQKGQGRGRKLGYPTANLGQIEQLIPAEGVYAGFVDVGGERFPAGISIGTTPTFDGRDLQVEAFLLDCQRALLGQPITMIFRRYLRAQEKFASAAALSSQIARDVEIIREYAGKDVEWRKC